MSQSRTAYEEAIRKKQMKMVSAKKAAEELAKAIEESAPIEVHNVDIRHCIGCQAEKFNPKDNSCFAYSSRGQARWMQLGWCPLGSSGPHKPIERDEHGKIRAGQQKQRKAR